MSDRGEPRSRRPARVASAVLIGLAGLLLPLGLIAAWAQRTVYDSETFSRRAVDVLDSPAVRAELSRRLTEQLVRSGNQQAIGFRPAVQLAVEAAIDTDSFHSIFRTAVRRTHAAILSGSSGSAGLDLADSVAIISSTIALPGNAKPTEGGEQALQSSVPDVTDRLGELGVWKLGDTIDTVSTLCLLGAVASVAGGIALAEDRRRCVGRLGWVVVADGLVIVVALQVLQWWGGRAVSDEGLSAAVSGALQRGTADLRTAGLWVAGYGVVMAAAARPLAGRHTPAEIGRTVQAWVERRRSTTGGTILVATLALLLGLLLVQDPLGNLSLIIAAAGLWLSYLGITELLRLVGDSVAAPSRTSPFGRRRRVVLTAGAVVVLVALLSAGLVFTAGGAARRAEAAGVPECNGKASLCDLRLDQVMFPGAHNAMSSSLYPGWLFGEQIDTINGQLDAGVRALLIDTHYGVPSTSRLPGSNSPLVLTDRAAELERPPGEEIDPAVAERAQRLAARAPASADAERDIYLCHNYCELGAVPFSDVLAGLKTFLDTHPDDVVMTIIQDATTPADTAAAFEAAGLTKHVATLRPGQPLPTLRDLTESGKNLLVFAEESGQGSPAWYHQAYQWFQETPFTYNSVGDFNCTTNRGPADAPLMLVNHWITASPPDPSLAAKANQQDVLEKRIEQCISRRGRLPNVVATDFAERGQLTQTLAAINTAKVDEVHSADRQSGGTNGPPPALRPASTVVTGGDVATAPVPEGTVVESLTGGDPGEFCPTVAPAVTAVVAWAETVLGESPGQIGVTDLAYGPLLQRQLAAYVRAGPDELARLAQPLLTRAEASVTALRALGLNDGDINALADTAANDLSSAASPDGVTTQATLVARLTQRIPADRLDNAAVVFSAGQPDPATLLDLGYLPPGVGEAAGFDCPTILASI